MLKSAQKDRASEWTLSAFFEKCLVSAETANFLRDTLLQLIAFERTTIFSSNATGASRKAGLDLSLRLILHVLPPSGAATDRGV
jgi:hypothetical protein